MDISTLNWFAVVAAALSNFLIGGLWYSSIFFGKVWMKENKFTEDELKNGNMPKILIRIYVEQSIFYIVY